MKDFSERIYQDYLSELDGLERFRQRFQERNPAVPLEREDPDVRRLIEAMAYFSVRTRHATMQNLRSAWRRLFSGFFDFLLEPVPASAMIQALPSEKMTEAVSLPRGTEVRLMPPRDSESDKDGVGVFRLQRDLRVLPVFLERSEVLPREEGGYRLILGFRSRDLREDPVDVLSLYVNHLDEYRSSLAVFHALRTHLEQVSVVYNATARADSAGDTCEVSFTRAPPAPDDAGQYAHPFQRMRAFFQLPEQQLFVHVKVPPSLKDWDRFSLCFDLDADWKVGRTHHPDFFVPFVAPVVNLKAEPAQVISADGTRSEFPIRGMSAGREFVLHSVTGVYEMGKKGLTPLRPAFLPGDSTSYEIEETIDEGLRAHQSLIVRMPKALTEPQKILVEALWYQPRFAPRATGRIAVSLPGKHIEGLRWQVQGSVRPHEDSPLRDDVAALTQILAWKTKPTLNRDEVVALMAHLGTPANSPFARVMPWLRQLTVSTLPDGALRGSGIQHLYEVVLEPFDPSFEPLVVSFLDQVRELLDVWNNEAMVELRATVDGRGPLPLLKVSA